VSFAINPRIKAALIRSKIAEVSDRRNADKAEIIETTSFLSVKVIRDVSSTRLKSKTYKQKFFLLITNNPDD